MTTSHTVLEKRTETMNPWWAVGAIALSTFSVVTTEMLPVGLLNPIADTFQAPLSMAGLMVTSPAMLAAVFAPAVVLASGGINRRTILCLLALLLVVANILSALSSSMNWMLASRTLVGFYVGGIWAIAGGLAARLVPSKSVGLATSIIFGGVAAASVLGMPIGAFIGNLLGWRMAFFVMAGFSAVVLFILMKSLPSLPVESSTSIKEFVAQIRNKNVLFGLFVTLSLVAGHFMAFTFVRPLLQSVSHYDAHWIGPLLFVYGVTGMVGNFFGGLISAKYPQFTLGLIAAALASSIMLFSVLGTSTMGSAFLIVLWGIAYGGVSVSLMTWMMLSAPKSIEVVTAFFVTTYNVGIASGAFFGGEVVDLYGLIPNVFIAGALTIFALVVIVLSSARTSLASRRVEISKL